LAIPQFYFGYLVLKSDLITAWRDFNKRSSEASVF